ncbi:hypothetical protein PG997_000263 [Apiospora hydei]|uniref:Up-regulated during septation protein 1 domain-containing protein n=1 Tax=Apiospora hydei TaxID=1337664 RepID=A0ABR1XA83_9PEZI
MDRHNQQQYPESIPPPPPASAEKRAPSLTRRQRVGVGTKRSTTPTPQRLSFAKPSAPPPPSASSSSTAAPNSRGSGDAGPGGAATTTTTNAAKYSFGKPIGDPPNAPLPRPPTDKKKSITLSSSNSSTNKTNSSTSSNNSTTNPNTTHNGGDWLSDTESALRLDLETTKKELELIRTIMWEMEMDDTSSSSPLVPLVPETTAAMAMAATQQRAQRKMLMAACREYTESRRQLLRERLRQTQFWAGSRDMGRRVPSAAPGDWALADAEWGRWLAEQAAAIQQQQGKTGTLSGFGGGEAGAIWGPLPHILATFTFSAEQG